MKGKIGDVKESIVGIAYRSSPEQAVILGSGFFVSDDGTILTSAHIYNQTPKEYLSNLCAIVMSKRDAHGGEEYAWLPINLVSKDDRNDIAFFKTDRRQETYPKPLMLGDSDKVELGDDVYFMGFPYAGNLMNEGWGITLIANRGMISNIKLDGGDELHPRSFFIVDAASNPGNSGSPLIDEASNKVIGVMSVSFRIQSKTDKDLDIREPVHISGARPINSAKKFILS